MNRTNTSGSLISMLSDGWSTDHPHRTPVVESPYMDTDERSTLIYVIELVTLCIMLVLGVVGNAFVCLVIHRSRRLQSTTNYFVVAMAAADLVYGSLVTPFLIAWLVAWSWTAGVTACKFVRFIQIWLPVTTTLIMVCICIDRYYTIIYPLSFKITRGRAKQMIAASWCAAALITCPALFLYATELNNGVNDCHMFINNTWQGITFLSFVTLIGYIVPLFILIIGFARIFRYLWQSGVGGRFLQRTVALVPRAKVKTVKMIMVLVAVNCFLLCPFFIIQLVQWGGDYSLETDTTLYMIMTWIVCLSTVSKPTIYMCYNSNFRRGCREVFCMSTMKCYRSNAYTITVMSKFAKKNHIGIDPTHRDYRKVNSPTKTFDRSLMIENAMWPLSTQVPSTYL